MVYNIKLKILESILTNNKKKMKNIVFIKQTLLVSLIFYKILSYKINTGNLPMSYIFSKQ